MVIPNSKLYLCKNIPLDPEYNYTLDFNDLSSQSSYFFTKVANEFSINTGYSYVRSTQQINVQANVDDLFGINYLFYENEDTNKVYYGFIIKKEYVSLTCTAITFKIDILQTFMFDYYLDECFVEREHQDRFIISDNKLISVYNTELENLDAGTDYDIISSQKLKDNADAPDGLIWLEVIATQAIATGTYNNSTPSTWKYLCMTMKQLGVSTNFFTYLIPVLIGNTSKNFWTYDGEGNLQILSDPSFFTQSTAVLSKRVLHYCPLKYTIAPHTSGALTGYLLTFTGGNTSTPTTHDITDMRVITANVSNFGGVDLSGYGGYFLNISRIDAENQNNQVSTSLTRFELDNDISINNLKSSTYEPKLQVFPYGYKQICDYQGNPFKIKNEYIDETKAIKFIQSYGIQSKLKFYVENYNNDNGKEYNTINSTISELPLTNDAYIAFMAQNKASATTGVAVNIGTGVATLGLGIATGGIGLIAGAGMAINSFTQIANNLLKMQDLKDAPDSIRQAGNNAEFDIIDNNFNLILTEFKIKTNYFNKIFNYFYHFGYKCNNFIIPNTKSRYYFNYIKTIGANIITNIDSEYRQELTNIFNNGITIWHYRDAETFRGVNNYAYENVETNLMEE